MSSARFFKKPIVIAVGAALGAALTIAGCNSGSDSDKSVDIRSVEFIGMDAPTAAADVSRSFTTATAKVTYSDNTTQEFPLSYNVLFRNIDRVGTNGSPAGQLYDVNGSPLMDPQGQPLIAETPDANSLLSVGGKLFLVNHWEYDWLLSDGSESYKWYSRMPMSMSLTQIAQEKESGKLTATDQRAIDFSGVGGIWIPCFGSQSPWNTHLGSEEDYDLDAKTIEAGTNDALKGMNELYFGNARQANPYHYGFIPEVTVKADGSVSVVKHYSMGRGTWEATKVMPDSRTAYFGDDGTNVGLFMYVADKAGDLSAGTLYAATWHQLSGDAGGKADLTWTRLGHATDAEVKAMADSLKFSDIFDTTKADTNPNWAAEGYKAIRAGYSSTEYIRLKPGMEKAAAALESRRYAAWLGATTEWNKMEGVAVNAKDKRLYIAMSYIDKGMLKDDTAPVDHIQVAKVNAGGTYELTLAAGQKDSTGSAINSEWVATGMYVPAALLGKDIAADDMGNIADRNRVANTDNLFFSEKMRTLFIGEDSGTHVNNYVWAYNVDTGKLSRILSLAAGAEATGLMVADNLNGHAYIMSNAQHYGDYIKTMNADLKAAVSPNVNKFEAPVGYIGGLPGM